MTRDKKPVHGGYPDHSERMARRMGATFKPKKHIRSVPDILALQGMTDPQKEDWLHGKWDDEREELTAGATPTPLPGYMQDMPTDPEARRKWLTGEWSDEAHNREYEDSTVPLKLHDYDTAREFNRRKMQTSEPDGPSNLLLGCLVGLAISFVFYAALYGAYLLAYD